VTDGDLRRALDQGGKPLLARLAGEVMTRAPRRVRPEMLAAEALRLMNTGKITSLFVVDDQDRPVGILHVHDLLRAGVA
jgi:arabinose-5-phosphate isomerase